MAPSPLSITLLQFFLLTTSTFLTLTSSTSHVALKHQPLQFEFRLPLTHVDSGRNLTKLQLIQRSINRAKRRLKIFKAISTAQRDNIIQAPVHDGDGEFLVNLSIGTPKIPFSAIVDTGSDLIWMQCNPCTKCFEQSTPIFDPTKSSTYENVSCSSELCSDVNIFTCSDGCRYMYMYGDESSTQGVMAIDTFTFLDSLNGNVSTRKIGFGCGVNNQGSGLGQGSGLVGLGRGPLSLVSQLGFSKFSYCLTTIGQNKTSSLVLGSLASGGTNYGTPLIQNPNQPTFYYVSLEGITVGETLLPISKPMFEIREDGSGGMIVDSGTTITYIQEDAFKALKKELISQMKLRVSGSSDEIGLDLCFDLPTKSVDGIKIPKLKFHFEGVDLELPAENYMIADLNMGLVCLAMGASDGLSIFGNIQQQNLLVLHDLDKETVSFLPTQCDQL